MSRAGIDRRSAAPATRDMRGILLALGTAAGLWAFLIIGVLGLVLKILR